MGIIRKPGIYSTTDPATLVRILHIAAVKNKRMQRFHAIGFEFDSSGEETPGLWECEKGHAKKVFWCYDVEEFVCPCPDSETFNSIKLTLNALYSS